MKATKYTSGFTLIEILITVAVLGILTAIVIPSYNGQTAKARRTDAKIALMDSVKILEKCYVINNAYNDAACTSFPAAGVNVIYSAEGHYKLVTTSLSATSYTLTASPVPGSPQSSDTRCLNFTINSTGQRGATNNDCW
jgi:type IV pilus assembly protein PilE